MPNRYLEATKTIPAGQTRSYAEVASLAARPGAARSAGRALLECPVRSRVPWHRVTAADGSLSRDAQRAEFQLAKLRREGARPRDGESVRAWAARVGAELVGKLPERVFACPSLPLVDGWGALRVEPLTDVPTARARGFRALNDLPIEWEPPELGGAPAKPATSLSRRLRDLPWSVGLDELERDGATVFRGALAPWDAHRLLVLGQDPTRFERTINMAPRGYGVGGYHYWKEPGPDAVRALRSALWRELRGSAVDAYGLDLPATLAEFHERCRAAGQRRGSSILLHYGPGGINHAHRDVYGAQAFPYQALVVLSRRGRDFRGGELLLYDERADGPDDRRSVEVSLGDLVVFASSHRYARRAGRRRRIPMRHGMSAVTRGHRSALGVVVNLAE